MTIASPKAGSYLVARMTVLALEASLPTPARSQTPSWRLAAKDSSGITSEDLVSILADMRKPVVCRIASTQAPIGLSCEYLPATDDVDDYATDFAASTSIIEGIRKEYGVGRTDKVISFRSRYTGASLPVSLEDLETWLKDYYIRSGSLIVRDPTETERLEGAIAVVELASSEGIRGEIEYDQ